MIVRWKPSLAQARRTANGQRGFFGRDRLNCGNTYSGKHFTSYQPPADFLEVLQQIAFEEALEPTDPRRVDTREARGSQQTYGRLARRLGLWKETMRFLPTSQKHVLFLGHVGSGKTTELKFYGAQLEATRFFLPVEVNVALVLDRNNLQYADLLMAMAHALLQALEAKNITLPRDSVAGLENWFVEKVKTQEKAREFTAEIEAGGKAEGGVPLLAKLFAKLSAAFKANATYKEELREVIRNEFKDLAAAFTF